MSDEQEQSIVDWMNKKATLPKFSVAVEKVDCFKREEPFVYFLKLASSELTQMNEELGTLLRVKDDGHAFIAHLSLFFPKNLLTEADSQLLNGLFEEVKSLEIEKLYLGGVMNHGTRMYKWVELG